MGILGEEGKQYVPYLMSTVIYIGIANIAGVFGFTPPTKDMNVTIALALMSIILIEYAGFHKKGLKGFLEKLCGAGSDHASNQYSGNRDQTYISLHAVVW